MEAPRDVGQAPPDLGIVMREVAGCGVAAFAARDFQPGDVVLAEDATLISAVSVKAENRELWQALVAEERSNRLPAFQPAGHLGALCALRRLGLQACREKLLTKCIGPEELLPTAEEAKREAQVLKTCLSKNLVPASASSFSAAEYARLRRAVQLNGFRFNGDLKEGESGYDVGEVMFNNVSRINHSCEPNLSFDLSRPSDGAENVRITVSASKPIQEGEEVNISYLPLEVRQKLKPKERRKELQQHWLFRCGCPRCCEEMPEQDEEAEVAAARSPAKAKQQQQQQQQEQKPTTKQEHQGGRGRSGSEGSSGSSSQGICWDDLADPDS